MNCAFEEVMVFRLHDQKMNIFLNETLDLKEDNVRVIFYILQWPYINYKNIQKHF